MAEERLEFCLTEARHGDGRDMLPHRAPERREVVSLDGHVVERRHFLACAGVADEHVDDGARIADEDDPLRLPTVPHADGAADGVGQERGAKIATGGDHAFGKRGREQLFKPPPQRLRAPAASRHGGNLTINAAVVQPKDPHIPAHREQAATEFLADATEARVCDVADDEESHGKLNTNGCCGAAFACPASRHNRGAGLPGWRTGWTPSGVGIRRKTGACPWNGRCQIGVARIGRSVRLACISPPASEWWMAWSTFRERNGGTAPAGAAAGSNSMATSSTAKRVSQTPISTGSPTKSSSRRKCSGTAKWSGRCRNSIPVGASPTGAFPVAAARSARASRMRVSGCRPSTPNE